ncbi:hypothetical protein GCM10011348_44640 [Marinobacterium nitratireducens]|uniref:Lipoprotein n=1 Tax=Marinobacterium nitratireducens TaxID=518897 RepID=A0A918DX35_9GAMM|nr:hypothetical protein [Marinobacterium nitratireducens]GGO88661.1 hypothetical protein GCM10011348_44640 [Marinobacterium nitratireducens]
MTARLATGLMMALPLLTACATDRYWYQPPAGSASSGTDGTWQGLIREDFSQRISHSAVAGAVGVRCARFQDLITLEVSAGRLDVTLGRSSVVRFDTGLDAGGRFSQQLPVQGDTWIYGGVGIYRNEPTLTIWGQLDPSTGTGSGHLSVTPGENQRIGCYASFRVSQNAGAPTPDKLGAPFKVQYWIDELDKGGDQEFWMLR